MAHTAGSKSFACVIEEQTVDGVPPSRAHVFLETHKDWKTKSAPMDEKSKQAVEMINEKLNDIQIIKRSQIKIQDDNIGVQRKMQEELTMLKMALFGRDILSHGT